MDIKEIEYTKYLLPKDYEEALPPYFFDFQGEIIEEVVMLKKILNKFSSISRVMELGVGTGRVTEILYEQFSDVSGIDISSNMIESVRKKLPNVKLENIDINKFVNDKSNFNDIDILCSFWAYNYAILNHYEEFDFQNKSIKPTSNFDKSNLNSEKMINETFLNLKLKSDFLIIFFDSTSVEQQFVTKYWSKIQPFPKNDRSYTYKRFLEVLNALEGKEQIQVDHETIKGFVYFDDFDKMIKTYLNLHFKGFFNGDVDLVKSIILDLKITMDKYKMIDGSYKIPAGVNIFLGKRI
ncbi:MAG: class I SAM-dependent methyltransferase [Firmicutes bacterium]|nr:class I SAM-dependent methyltransferase [Bacillota bacterium]